MFTSIKSSLITRQAEGRSKRDSSNTNNSFVLGALENSAKTVSGNGAVKYSTTGNSFVDQFGKLGSYKKPRSYDEISKDCELLWADDKLNSVKFISYLRTITRKVSMFDGSVTEESQLGAELKHEAIYRMIWLYFKSEKTFWENISLFISLGSWKDIITMLSYDLQYHGWNDRKLNWNKFGELILSGLENKNTSELLKKYLPAIKANSKLTTLSAQADTIIAKWICSLLFGTKDHDVSSRRASDYKKYRKLKSSGNAHEWQQLISQKKFDRIDFNKIHGRALSLLVKGKFLTNSGLSNKYNSWITKPETEVKYTGFVHELFSGLGKFKNIDKNREETINKQFDTLVKKAGEKNQTSLIVVRDTSSSMGSIAFGTNMSCYDIGKALALYFSEFLTGSFSNAWIEFNSDAKMHTWKGHTPVDKWFNDRSSFVGGTNFQSVIKLFVNLKRQGIPESEFPTGILCISDSEFNPGQLKTSNVNEAKLRLAQAGFSSEYIDNFVIILWNLQSSYYGRGTGEKFETYGDVANVFYFSGYSASTIKFLSSKIKNARELFDEAMNQEILNMIKVY